jgi:molybdate transport system permease protein
LSFAHTVGEFGVLLILGRSIPGVTRVASIALHDEVQNLNYSAAHSIALLLLGISFPLIFAIVMLQRRAPIDASLQDSRSSLPSGQPGPPA